MSNLLGPINVDRANSTGKIKISDSTIQAAAGNVEMHAESGSLAAMIATPGIAGELLAKLYGFSPSFAFAEAVAESRVDVTGNTTITASASVDIRSEVRNKTTIYNYAEKLLVPGKPGDSALARRVVTFVGECC